MSELVRTNDRQSGKLAPVQATAEHKQYLTFMLGGEVFAIGILAIKEIIEFGGLTAVPMMPECVRGVINLRGAVVPVIDLSVRFGRQETAVGRRTCIVVVEIPGEEADHVIGVMVDAVNAVLEIATSDIEPGPAFGPRIRTDFIEGMGKVNGKFVILLNVESVLSVDEVAGLGLVAVEGAALLTAQSSGGTGQ